MKQKKISRRGFLAGAAVGAAAVAAPALALTMSPQRPIVMIFVDDLFSIEHYRYKFGVRIHTPNFDRLMGRGISFMNAFCTTAICNPLRMAIMTGQNPFKTGVHYHDDQWQKLVAPEATLFAMLKKNGWSTYSIGKTIHVDGGGLETTPVMRYLDQAFSKDYRDVDADKVTTDVAIQRMKFLPRNPYFLALGLYDPHLPHNTEPRFRELYPLSKIKLPDWTGFKQPSWISEFLRAATTNKRRARGTLDNYVQGYLANISEMDFNLGRMIDNIDLHCRNPLIILTSDHGYSAGDHRHIGKFTLWDDAGRAPLIIVDPSSPHRNVRFHDAVSLLDIAPTILDYAGLPIPEILDGRSLRPLINDPSLRRYEGAFTTMFGSSSLRRNGYRFTRYEDGSEEVFTPGKDPDNTNNLIAATHLQDEIALLRQHHATRLAAWKGSNPKCDTRVIHPPGDSPVSKPGPRKVC